MKSRRLLFVAALAAAGAAAAVEPEAAAPAVAPLPAEIWLEAKAAYEAGDYPHAAELYRRLAEQGQGGGHLLYNLGNAYLRNGELGRAIASYLRSQAELPRDGDVAANLEFARKSTKDALAPPAPSALLSTLCFWHFGLSRSELGWLVVIFNLLFWASLALRLVRPEAPGARAAALVLLTALLATGISWGWRHLRPDRVAVVIPQEVPAFVAPDPDSVVRFKLHAGSELRIGARREGWLRIRLPDGEQGWIEEAWAEVVER